jgi:ATP-binding cassette, subfamily C (CFTR/MRP), member 1
MILSALVSYFEGNKNLSKMELWAYAVAMFVLPMVSSLIAAKSNIIVVNTAVQFRNAMVNMIFRKALLLSPESRQQQSTGKIINMFANDTKQIQNLLYIFNNLIVSPIQIAVTLYLIYLQVGVSTFIGLGYMVLITPLNGLVFGSLNKTRKDKVVQTDYRVKLMNEILNGIRVIKYYAWEGAFKDKIEEIRVKELFYLKKIAYIVAFGFSLLFYSTPMILPCIIFYSYIRLGHSLDASTAFTTIALFNMLQMPFAFLPIGIVQYLQSRVSVGRITDFLLSGELQGYVQGSREESSLLPYTAPDTTDFSDEHHFTKKSRGGNGNGDDIVVSIVNGNLGWEHDSAISDDRSSASSHSQRVESSRQGAELLETASSPLIGREEKASGMQASEEASTINRSVHTLMGINVEIKKGALVAIVGAVGSGKSSLLNAILGEVRMPAFSDGFVYIFSLFLLCYDTHSYIFEILCLMMCLM